MRLTGLFILWFSLAGFAQNKNLLLQSTFENESDLLSWGKETCCSHSLKVSDSVSRSGRQSLRFELDRTDSLVANGKRAELKLKSETDNDRWYAFSIFLPETYVQDVEAEILAQWHEIPDFNLGESWRTPPIDLMTKDSHWVLEIKWATDSVNTNQTISGRKTIDLGTCVTKVWTDFVIHIKFSYKEDGMVQAWKDGKLVFNYKGPNTYNDKTLPYFKIGIYKWRWKDLDSKSKLSRRIVYFDNVIIGNENATYKDFVPSKALRKPH